MSLNNDTPISGLPEKQRDPILDDLLITSQLISPGQYFTAKLTIASVYALFMADIKISDVKLLQATLDAMQLAIDSKLDGSHTHVIAEITGLQNALDNKAAVNHSHTIGQIAGLQAALDAKLDNATHTHTISQVTGLQAALNQKANLNHTHDMSDINNLVQALAGKLNVSLKGVANGLAELDASGRVPLSQSHLFIIERTNSTFFPTVGEGGKFYVDMQTGVSYRWNGAAYVPLSTGQDYLQLGETSTTAYRGDRGKIAYDHSQSAHAPLDAQKNVQSDWNATSGDALILNKPATMPPSEHTHAYADLTGTKPPTDAQKNVQSDWFASSGDAFIKNKPTSFPPTSHSHDYNDITGSKPPINAQKNSDITKAEIEAKLTGTVGSHTHAASTIAGLQAWCDDLYLALTGGTLTGNLNIGTVDDAANLAVHGDATVANLIAAGTITTPSFINSLAQTIIQSLFGKLTIVTASGDDRLFLQTDKSRFEFNKSIRIWQSENDAEGYLQVNVDDDSGDGSAIYLETNCGYFDFGNKGMYWGQKSFITGTDPFNGYTDGYSTMMNGLIIQWGYVDDDGLTKNFPIAFPHCCMVITASVVYDGFYTGNNGNMFHIVSNSQFRLRNGGAASAGSGDNAKNSYIAIGW